MILMIDNYDSFTYNIVQYCKEIGIDIKLIKNDEYTLEEIISLNPKKLIISPGPSSPDESGVCLEVIKYFSNKIPILGICLGHQCIASVFGAKIIEAKNMMHGKTSDIKLVANSIIFDTLPKQFRQTRYHSLLVQKEDLPLCIIPTAYSLDDGEIMALEIKDKQIYGVQFHPESIMSEYGHEILDNFLKI